MSLKIGAWKLNENGVEDALKITSVDPNSGVVAGSIGANSFAGLWDETSRTLTFFAPVLSGGEVEPAPPRFYKGFLFSTPRNPAPGQDVLWTLVGFVQVTDSAAAGVMGGNVRRNMFGWFAQISEVA